MRSRPAMLWMTARRGIRTLDARSGPGLGQRLRWLAAPGALPLRLAPVAAHCRRRGDGRLALHPGLGQEIIQRFPTLGEDPLGLLDGVESRGGGLNGKRPSGPRHQRKNTGDGQSGQERYRRKPHLGASILAALGRHLTSQLRSLVLASYLPARSMLHTARETAI